MQLKIFKTYFGALESSNKRTDTSLQITDNHGAHLVSDARKVSSK